MKTRQQRHLRNGAASQEYSGRDYRVVRLPELLVPPEVVPSEVVASGVVGPLLLPASPVPDIPPEPDILPVPEVPPPIVPYPPPVADVPPAPDAPPAPDELLCAKAPTEVAISNVPAAIRDSALEVMILHLRGSQLRQMIKFCRPEGQHRSSRFDPNFRRIVAMVLYKLNTSR